MKKSIILIVFTILLISVLSIIINLNIFKNPLLENTPVNITSLDSSTEATPKQIDKIFNEEFNQSTLIPSTGVTFKYPKNGFFNGGAEITFSNKEVPGELPIKNSVHLNPTNRRFGNASLHITINKITDTINNDDVVKVFRENGGNLSTYTGHYEIINNHKFYILRGTYDYMISAMTLGKDGLIFITLQNGFDSNYTSGTPDIFKKILANIEFE